MNPSIQHLRAFCCTVALLFCTAWLIPTSAAAQITCCDITFDNNTACPITWCIRTASGPLCVTVAAGGSAVITLPASLCNNPPIYVVDRCGNNVKIPVGGCATVALAPNCCARICLNAGIAGCWFVTATPLAINCLCPLPADLSEAN